MATFLPSSCFLRQIPFHKQNITRNQAFQVRAQTFGDEGRWRYEMIEKSMSVLRERIKEVKMKERLERCCRCEYGWCYGRCYELKLKRKSEFSEMFYLFGLVCGTVGFTCLTCTFLLYLVSLVVHFN